MADPQLSALINAIQTLQSSITRSLGAGVPIGGGPPAPAAMGTVHGSIESLRDELIDLTKATRDSTKQQKDTMRSMEIVGGTMAMVGPMLQQFTKYNITLPYEMLGGTAGSVGRHKTERERETGQLITGIVGGLSILLGAPALGGVVLGAGALGLNAILGRVMSGGAATDQASRRTLAEMQQAEVMEFLPAAMSRYSLAKSSKSIESMGLGSNVAESWSLSSASNAMGLRLPEMQALVANAVTTGGSLGFRRMMNEGGIDLVAQMVNEGFAGTDPQVISQAIAAGFKYGMTKEEMFKSVEQTGLELGEVVQARAAMKSQMALYSNDVISRTFSQVSGTRLAKEIGIQGAAATFGQVAQSTAAAAGGGEAQEMMMFAEFKKANPGASYMDFLEAKSNPQQSDSWKRMLAQSSKRFAYGGQEMRIAGRALGFAGQGGTMALGRSAEMLDQMMDNPDAPGKRRPSTQASLDAMAQSMIGTGKALSVQSSALLSSEHLDNVLGMNKNLIEAAGSAKNFSEYLSKMADEMERMIDMTGLSSNRANTSASWNVRPGSNVDARARGKRVERENPFTLLGSDN